MKSPGRTRTSPHSRFHPLDLGRMPGSGDPFGSTNRMSWKIDRLKLKFQSHLGDQK